MSDLVYVSGHRNPDTDSICSAIAYSYLLWVVFIGFVYFVLGFVGFYWFGRIYVDNQEGLWSRGCLSIIFFMRLHGMGISRGQRRSYLLVSRRSVRGFIS